MASNNEYKRYFIILQEDDKGYEMAPGKIPTGYVKIEIKNGKVRLNAFVQNVKQEDRIEYRLILVASNKKLAADVGKMIIDGSGRGELSCEFESDNVLKSGLSIGDFNVAAVTSGVSIPLSGYTGRDKLDWKGKYEIINRPKDQEVSRVDKKITIEEIMPEVQLQSPVSEQPAAPPKPEVAPPEPIVEEQPAPKPDVHVEISPVAEPEPVPEPVAEAPEPVMEEKQIVEVQIEIPECPPLVPMEEPCEVAEPCEIKKEEKECEDMQKYYCDDDDAWEEKHKHYHEEYHKCNRYELPPYYSSVMYSRLRRMLRKLKDYEPFEKEKGYEWFRVSDDIYELNSVRVPYMGYMIPLGYPFISEGCGMLLNRKDYILGVKYDDKYDSEDRRLIKYLLFGVPAIYSKRNEMYYRSRGFTVFRPHKSRDYGYFIMCLDLRRGMLCRMD